MLVTATLWICSGQARAASFTVDTTEDDPGKTGCDAATPNDCSLRGAVLTANALAEASTIDVPAGTYVLSQQSSCTYRTSAPMQWTSSQIPLCISGRVTLRGMDAATTIIDANRTGRVLFVGFDAVAEVRGVTLTNGIADYSFPIVGNGGDIHNRGTLTLTEAVVSNGTLPVSVGGAVGAGLYNAGSLTLVRSTVTGNGAPQNEGGGGIYNDGFVQATLTVIDSVISNNTIGRNGGGIRNDGVATITGSTISGNTATHFSGGGISNSGTVTMTNSTVSGNQSGSSGAGISNAGIHSAVQLNNVTIANNTAGLDNRGQGGGIDNAVGLSLALRNTIVAGNLDLSGTPPKNDCDARTAFSSALVSQGHNLIQDTTGCDITGDKTGNITGQDAKLSALASNSGPTPTHALADDSPAKDAGNPAPPGSGGDACTATDQRGFLRPFGAACDIGAFERGGGFALSKVTPSTGGDIGSVSALVSGNGFVKGATVKLARAGQADIAGDSPHVDAGGSAIVTTFDLAGRAIGPWDVTVTNPDATTKTLPGGFTVEAGRAADLWVDVVGQLKRHAPSRFTVTYGNRGNVDALAVPLFLSASSAYGFDRYFDIAPPPAQPDQIRVNWDQVGITADAGALGNFTNVPLLLPVVPAGFRGVLQFQLRLPTDPSASTLFVDIGSPYLNPALDPQIVTDMVQGARDYAPEGLGTTIPPAYVPAMEHYATNQLQALVDEGRVALNASVGTVPPVYSIDQLQIDTAIFGGARAAAEEASARRNLLGVLAGAGAALSSCQLPLGPAAALAQRQDCPYVKCGTGALIVPGCSCVVGPEPILPPDIPPPPGCDPTDYTRS